MKTSLRLAAALALCAALPARAGGVEDNGAPWLSALEMPRGTAMGGAHAAVATGNDALVVNPAGLAQRRRYHLQLDGTYDVKFPASGFSLSVVDSNSTMVGTGFLLQRYSAGEEGKSADGWLFGLGYAYPAGGFFFGGETKYLRFTGPAGETRQFAQDLGILGTAGSFTWALVTQNLSTSVVPLFPPTATAAIAIGSDHDFRLAFDWKSDLTDTKNLKHRGAVGLEFLIDQSVVVRGGYSWSPTYGHHWVSAGIGLVTDKLGLSLAWRRRVGGPLDQYLQAALTLYLE